MQLHNQIENKLDGNSNRLISKIWASIMWWQGREGDILLAKKNKLRVKPACSSPELEELKYAVIKDGISSKWKT